MSTHTNRRWEPAALCLGVLLLAGAARPLFAGTINLENQCPSGVQPTGACSSLFANAGNAQGVNVSTSIGVVKLAGGVLMDGASYLPADTTAIYGTAGNAANIGVSTGSGFANPLTLTFPTPITNLFLDVLNGNTMDVNYQLADNSGNSASFLLTPNLSAGMKTIGFAATGNIITISAMSGQSTSGGMTWDFFIDNIHFNESLPGSVPEPASLLLIGAALVGLGIKRRKAILPLLVVGVCAQTMQPMASAATTAGAIALACPANTGTVGVGYSSSLTATGGVAPYTYSLKTGALPSGLTLNPSTGAIMGTPTSAGNASFTGQTVDSLIPGGGGAPDSATAACGIDVADAAETWMQMFDLNAVHFGQVSPMHPESIVPDWQTGIAFVDYRQLSLEGTTDGYIQVLEFDPSQPSADPVWVVQNFPIHNANVLAGNSMPFPFGTHMKGPAAGMPAAVYTTKKPVPPPPPPPVPFRPPVMPAPARPQFFPIHPVPTTIGGFLIPPPANPPAIDKILPIDPDKKRTDSQDALTEANSVEQQRNECAPASVANSMEYLQVKDGAKNVPAGQAKSRVASLDFYMGYNILLGTSPLGILNGKKRYIEGKNPSGKALDITMDSQGRFCPGPSIDLKCPGGQDGASGTTPKEDFITKALAAKKDVEICFAWPAKPASPGPPPAPFSPGGAHCVFVTGYRFINGYLTLDITQDLNQGAKGGVDWEDGGHMALRVGAVGDELWIRNWFDRQARITHVITEAPK